MIVSFASKGAEDLFNGNDTKDARKVPVSLWRIAQRKLDMLNAAAMLKDLKAPPANRLEALKGRMKGKWSIRVNDQYRLIFEFKDGNVYGVEIADYH